LGSGGDAGSADVSSVQRAQRAQTNFELLTTDKRRFALPLKADGTSALPAIRIWIDLKGSSQTPLLLISGIVLRGIYGTTDIVKMAGATAVFKS
jgi:hypothetical protein